MNKLIYIFLFFISCSDFPKDPGETLKKITNDTLRVGIAESGDYATFKDNIPVGIEVEIIKIYAKSVNSKISWTQGNQDYLIKLLEEDQIDIAIGGFVKNSPFENHAGWTRPFGIEKVRLASPHGTPIPKDLKGHYIQVRKGSNALITVKKGKAIPVIIDTHFNSDNLIAATEEELSGNNLSISKKEIDKIKHVFAIRKGENAFLESIDRFIYNHVEKK